MIWLIPIGLLILFIVFYHKFIKLRLGSITLFTGSVKCGKTLTSVNFALSEIKKRHLKWQIRKFLGKKEEEPLLYSNMPIKCKYFRKLEKSILYRTKRCNYKSVVLIDEASLLADSMTFNDKELNNNLLLFMKLFGHSTKGGILILNTQNILDLHYNIKRCITDYYQTVGEIKWLPFVHLVKIRQMEYTEDNSTINVHNTDTDKTIAENSRWLILFKSLYKKYDRFGLSILTDEKPLADERCFRDNKGAIIDGLKYNEIVSFSEVGDKIEQEKE